jgi:hypothetical protein
MVVDVFNNCYQTIVLLYKPSEKHTIARIPITIDKKHQDTLSIVTATPLKRCACLITLKNCQMIQEVTDYYYFFT